MSGLTTGLKKDSVVSTGIYRGGVKDNSQSIIDAIISKPSYLFDGVNDDVTIADDSNIDFGTGDFTIFMGVKVSDITRTTDHLINKEASGVGWGLYINTDDLYIRLDDDTEDSSGIIGTNVFEDGKPIIITISFDRDGLAIAYANGVEIGTVDISDSVLTLSSAGDLHIGNDSAGANEFAGEIPFVSLYNRVLTPSEIKTLSNTVLTSYLYSGASQTELMPNTVDRDFSGASAWANVDVDAYSETDDLTITASAADQYCTLLVASAPTTIGKRYIMSFDVANIASTWEIQSFDGNQTLGIVSADGATQTIEWTATTTGGYRIVALADDSSGDFDNFTLNSLGCVLNLNDSGVGHNTWVDISGNDLYGVVTGAIPINLPMNHVEQYINSTITDDGTFTLPKGYQITSVITKETAGNSIGGGMDIGVSSGSAEIVAAGPVTGSATETQVIILGGSIGGTHTTADDTIYISDADGTGWDSASVDIRITMIKRVV